MSIETIGIDHITRSEKFYDRVMRILGFRKNTFSNEGDHHIQYYKRHSGFVLRPARSRNPAHDPLSPGLHHFCFRVEDAATVDAIAERLAENGVDCSTPQLYPEYAPDYYALFFSDPDGIVLRLRITDRSGGIGLTTRTRVSERRRRRANW